MVRKCRRKKLPVPERQPLVRPRQPNEVWTMDFVFDELANGRRVNTLMVVDDCSEEAVQIADLLLQTGKSRPRDSGCWGNR
jgi:putative transposase